MATLANRAAPPRSGDTRFAAFADRWIYVFMAALFIVTVLVGFIPDSAMKIDAVNMGKRPPFPLILHFHAAAMGCWLLLLFAQATLAATGRTALHKQLGLTSLLLVPIMFVTGFLVVPAMDGQVIDGIRHGPPEVAAQLRAILPIPLNIMMIQIRIGIVFPVLIAIALAARNRDPGLHKRLMFLATLTTMPAATDRIAWIPSTMPGSALTVDLWPLVLIAPMFAWDLIRQQRIHRAYWIWLGVSAIPALTMHLLWGSDWWRRTALMLLGASDIA